MSFDKAAMQQAQTDPSSGPYGVKGVGQQRILGRVGMQAPSALAHQEGGRHYKDMPIQPVEFIHANAIGYFEGNVIKYVARWRQKNGIEDLKKAKHYIELLIDLETRNVEHARGQGQEARAGNLHRE